MERRDANYVVIAALLLSGLYVSTTGLVADVFGLHQFIFHNYAGYACVALSALHLALNWDRVTLYLSRRFGSRREVGAAGARPRIGQKGGRRAFLFYALASAGGYVLGRLIPPRRVAELPAGAADVAQLYHNWSKPDYGTVLTAISDWGRQPEQYKTYPGAARTPLPEPRGYRGLGLEESIEKRRSVRQYLNKPMSQEELSRLLHAAGGITGAGGLRAAPSAGALYPVELYVVVNDVEGLERGIYHHDTREHALEMLKQGDFRGAITAAGLGQSFLGEANVCVVMSAVFQRTRWRYRERAYRYVLMEVGHIGQNVYLAATSMGMGACAVGAFLDGQLNDMLGLDGEEEAALYVVSVGRT